jgi:diguanylate cyclase (GGDEF)-like protein
MPTRATDRSEAGAARMDSHLRAAYRRELIDSVAVAACVVAAGIAIATAVICVLVPRVALAQLGVAAVLLLPTAAIALWVRRRGRRFVVPLGMVVGWMPMLSAAFSLVLLPDYEAVAHVSVGLVPLAFAAFIPLQRRPHQLWLIAANAAFFGVLAIAGGAGRQAELPALLVIAALAGATSVACNEIQLRRRNERNRQVLAMRGLYARMKERELDLHRQDDFLFMQQETLLAQQAELLRLNEELNGFARLDPLTGVGNRLRLNEDLAQMAARIERSGGTAGLLLIDLDRFKRLNDSQGHLAGDAALRAAADALHRTSRASDGVYRYGGEEFLVILHDCDEAALQMAGQRYLSAIEATGIPHPENTPWCVMTASAGAVELSKRNCVDIDVALHDADEALYRAKARGRNRLELQAASDPVRIEPRRVAS